MKRLRLTLLPFVMLIAVLPAAAQSSTISLSAPVEQVRAGETFAVTIQVQDVVDVYGGSIQLAYDPQLLEVIETEDKAVTPGDLFANQPGFSVRNAADPVSGSIEYVLTLRQPAEPVTGSGSLGTVQFRALQDGPVQVNVVEATLLSPRFEEVEGRTIARQIDQVPVEVQGLVISTGDTSLQSVSEEAIVPLPTQALAAAAPPQSAPVIEVPLTAPALVQATPTLSPAVMLGLLFFVIGLLLFTLSLGAYVRLRRQYAWE